MRCFYDAVPRCIQLASRLLGKVSPQHEHGWCHPFIQPFQNVFSQLSPANIFVAVRFARLNTHCYIQ